MNKTWIIVIAVAVIGVIAYFILRKGPDTTTTTTTGTSTSNETNGLLGAIGGFIGGIGDVFGGGTKTES